MTDTALGPMMIAAVEQQFAAEQRLLTDDLAIGVLPAALRWTAHAARWNPLRQLLIRASDRQAPGIWNWIACRKRYIDDVVAGAVADGIDAMVNLGAGLDTRAIRLTAPAGIPAFEVDLPINIDAKRNRLRLPHNVTQVPLDFGTDDLAATLAAHGHAIDRKTVFVWEGVTQYLTDDAVRATLDVLSRAGTGSRLVFTYVRTSFLDGTTRYGADGLYHRFVVKDRIWRYGMHPADVGPLLSEYGWHTIEHVGAETFANRYLRPAGRTGPISELECCVHAEKL